MRVRSHCSLSFFLIASFSTSPCHGTGSWRGASRWYVPSPWRCAPICKSTCWSRHAAAISLLSAIHSIASWRCILRAEAGRGIWAGGRFTPPLIDAVRRFLANFCPAAKRHSSRVWSRRLQRWYSEYGKRQQNGLSV